MQVKGNVDPRLVEFTTGQSKSQVPHPASRSSRGSFTYVINLENWLLAV
jgi:hypothetical protein